MNKKMIKKQNSKKNLHEVKNGLVEKATANTGNNPIGCSNKLVIPENRPISAAELFLLDIPETPHVFPGLIPQGLTLFAGKPKKGKSYFCLNVSSSIAYGEEFLGQTPSVQEVLYVALEDNIRRMKNRLLASLSEKSIRQQNHNLKIIFNWPRLGRGGLLLLEKYLTENSGTKLVIFDTWNKLRGIERKGSSPYEKDYGEISDVKKIADKFNIAIMITHHTIKSKMADAFDMITGSNGLTGASDNIILLTKQVRENEAVLTINSRDIDEQDLALKFDKDTSRWKLMGKPAEEYLISVEQKEILEFFKKEQEEGPLKLANVAEFLGKKKPNVYKLTNKLVEKNLLEKVGFGKYQLKTEEEITAPTDCESQKPSGTGCENKPHLKIVPDTNDAKEGAEKAVKIRSHRKKRSKVEKTEAHKKVEEMRSNSKDGMPLWS